MPTIIRFGVFELDLENQELRKAGLLIKLRPQPFKLLALLVTRAGKLVSRDQIRQAIWDTETNVDFEQGVNRCIKEIRSGLSDDAKTPRYIKAVHRRGYMFIAAVHGLRRPPEAKQEIQESQLTTHSHEASITTAAISPDGRYLAYSDDAEVYVKLIETGETHPLRALQSCRVAGLSWFPDSTKLLARGEDWRGNALWAVSIFGGVLWKVTHNAGDVAVLEGSYVAFIGDNGKEVWLMRTGGEDPHRVYVGEEGDKLGLVQISEGPKLFLSRLRVGAYQFEVRIECLDLDTGRVRAVLADPRLRGTCLSPGGRLIYALAETASRQSDVNLWEVGLDVQTGQVAGQTRRLTNWIGSNLYCLSTTRDGSRLAFLKGPYQASVFIGELEEKERALKNARRLTLDDRNNLPTAWTADSKAILFHSDRNGKWEIFKQDLNERPAELIVRGSEDCRAARMSPDAAWILYFARNRDRLWNWSEPLTLMRLPVAGGSPSVVLSERRLYSVRCARPPATVCVLGERRLKHVVFYAFDPLHGKGQELTTTAVDLPLDQNHWDLSPDGSRIALLAEGDAGRIRIVSLPGGSTQDVAVKGWSGFQSMDWSASGKGLYVSSQSAMQSTLLHIDLEGAAHIMRQQMGHFQTWGIPSPNGKYLAFLEWTAASNVWMIENL